MSTSRAASSRRAPSLSCRCGLSHRRADGGAMDGSAAACATSRWSVFTSRGWRRRAWRGGTRAERLAQGAPLRSGRGKPALLAANAEVRGAGVDEHRLELALREKVVALRIALTVSARNDVALKHRARGVRVEGRTACRGIRALHSVLVVTQKVSTEDEALRDGPRLPRIKREDPAVMHNRVALHDNVRRATADLDKVARTVPRLCIDDEKVVPDDDAARAAARPIRI